MLRFILLNWFAARYGDEIRDRIFETAAQAAQEAAAGAKEAADSQRTDSDAAAAGARERAASFHGGVTTFQRADVGFVFALGQEYGCFLDLLKNVKTTKGNGLKYHEALFGPLRIAIVESGIGQEAARAATLALIQAFRPRRVVSAGFSGGLVPSLRRNQIVLPRDLIQMTTGKKIDLWQRFLPSSDETEKGQAVPSDALRADSRGAPNSSDAWKAPKSDSADAPSGDDPFDRYFAAGPLLTSDEVVSDPAEKKRLRDQFGAALVDMETFAVADACRSMEVPFLAVRVILDPVEEKLPSDLKILTDSASSGTARLLGAFFGTVTRRPSSLWDIYRLKENALVAADTLADALASILKTEIPSPKIDETDGSESP